MLVALCADLEKKKKKELFLMHLEGILIRSLTSFLFKFPLALNLLVM